MTVDALNFLTEENQDKVDVISAKKINQEYVNHF